LSQQKDSRPLEGNGSDSGSAGSARIVVRGLYKVFGSKHQAEAMRLADRGKSKSEIQKQTGCTVAVDDVSFQVQPHEIFVIMGLSGCGKSTVLRCLNRLIEPTAGEVLVDGQNILELRPSALRSLRREKMAMVFQNFGLLPHRSVLENAAFGLEIQETSREQRFEKARSALEIVGLDEHADQPVQSLSGGMQQRVGLARALATDSEILLMDEAFSALDPLIRTEMQDELVSLQEKMRKTIVFISHDLDEALRLGDRIGIMKDGKMVQVGQPEEILMQPRDDYIRDFVENVDRSRVLTAGAITRPAAARLRPETSVRAALSLFHEHSLETLFVVDRSRRFLGSVDIDTVAGQVVQGDVSLESLIDRQAARCAPETPLEDILPLASQTHQPIAVVDAEDKFLGLVTRTAILVAIAHRGKSARQGEDKHLDQAGSETGH